MPPAAIPSSVRSTSSVSPRRSSSSSTECGGNFGARPKPPHSGVERRAQPAHGLAEQRLGERLRRRRATAGPLDRRDQLGRRAGHVPAPLAVRARDRLEHLAEARQPVTRLRREVRAAVERLTVRREERGQRPAAVPGQRHDRVHVDRVEVRAFLAVDLDVDEVLVLDARRLLVLERLVLHHVAPVARGVADGEEDRPVLLARAGERLLAPRVPVDGVVRVLEEVRTGRVSQPIHVAPSFAAEASERARHHPRRRMRSRARRSGPSTARPRTACRRRSRGARRTRPRW